ncbi:uncharacterized protein LOC113326963 [Papaver somniferum]|uniref:uncharacterized protein LOC113326963 n=1 Tax=Papaver somniferum TaxID=3469 RepID=UPI000E703574|nr:uncharacterized protein LOC113326963 [Papaver somniferum]
MVNLLTHGVTYGSSLGSATPNPLVSPDPSIKVSYFIDTHTRTWNMSILNTHFDNATVKKIVTIPLSQLCTPDKRAWDLSKNGKFSSKSAYTGLRGLRPSPCKNLWMHVWKIWVPCRIQVFTWKAARNALPSRTILYTRMLMHNVDCARCNDPQESILYSLALWPFASRVWFLSDFCIDSQFFQNKFFIDWLLFWLIDHLSRLPDEAQCIFVAILWSLWTSRNNLIFQNIQENHTTFLVRARSMLLTRKTCLTVSHTTPVNLCVGWIKCNIDGAYDDISGSNGAGFVMRDFSKKASFCASLVFEVKSAEEAEARAICAVLKKALEQQLTHVIVESDAKTLIDQFSAGQFDGDSCTDDIFKDIQFFSSKLVACIFSFQPRVCNFVAHELAQWAETNNASMYWFVPLVWLLPIVEGGH